jgi:SAM-dependent methyltransferase
MLRAVSEAAAQSWPWERMARSNAPSHDVLVEALDPMPKERWIDVGTGSGGVALRAARRGAEVVGVDISSEAIERARAAAAEEGLGARFEVGDAAALAFPDSSFDVVASAFGVMFGEHARMASELARVCRPAGRLGLTLMPPTSRAAEMWTLLRRFGVGNGDHPGAFAERVDELLGESFAFESRHIETEQDDEHSPEEAWKHLSESFGPLRKLLARVDEATAVELRREFLALGERFAGTPCSYVLVLGRRR